MRWTNLTLVTSALLAGVLVSWLPGCGKSDAPAPAGPTPEEQLHNGESIYRSMCQSCHGPQGEGAKGPALRDVQLRRTEADLTSFIDASMPLGDPAKCTGTCAADVAKYVFNAFRGPLVCDVPEPAARGLRLLTRREYANTVRDLLGMSPSAPPACEPHTFTYDPGARSLTSVHVAGSFNGWSSTIAGGGWPLQKIAGAQGGATTWTLTRQLPKGHQTYKFVLNESEWIADPTNPSHESDGFGGQNSVVDVGCEPSASASTWDPTATFPLDTRPEGFPFDDHGPGRVVTSVLADEQLRAARAIAKAADVAKLAGCDLGVGEPCLRNLVTSFGRRAFRRPLTDGEVTRYVAVANAVSGGDAGARAAIASILVSPSFLYRSEIGVPTGATFHLTPWEVAAALSYFFWATTPDDALLAAAESGELAGADGIERQARRLLADPRAREQIAVFADQWLGSETVASVNKSESLYPDFDDALRAAMREETRQLVTHVVFDGNHKLDELFRARYTFVNERLARHYGFGGVTGTAFQKVLYPDDTRSGILAHASILATTGHSDQSSPIRRGLFVRRRLLCQEFPPPPPNAGGVPKVDPGATTRERFAQHTANAFCKSCHQYIDSVGFGFEEFDTVGRVRTEEAGKPIDHSGDMNDVEGLGTGTHAPFSTMTELAGVLAASDASRSCVARQVFRFARGRIETGLCEVDAIQRRWLDKGGDLRELLIAVVTADSFVVRR